MLKFNRIYKTVDIVLTTSHLCHSWLVLSQTDLFFTKSLHQEHALLTPNGQNRHHYGALTAHRQDACTGMQFYDFLCFMLRLFL